MTDNPTKLPPIRPFSRLFYRLLVAIGVLLLVAFVLLYLAMGTHKGSELVLQKIAQEANMSFTYTQGTLLTGIHLSDVAIAQDGDVAILIDKAYVKMGFRALLAKQIHITKSTINTVRIINKKPPTGEPFDYATIALPVALLIEDSTIANIYYEQASQSPIHLTNLSIAKIHWYDSDVGIDDTYFEFGDQLAIKLAGDIQLKGDYPLDLSAQVAASSLSDIGLEPIKIVAQGTLKRTVGTLKTAHNNHTVQGDFVVQGVDDNSPFWAKLYYDKMAIAYNDQDIVLSNGQLSAIGVISAIDVRFNTHAESQDIPKGHYKGRTLINTSGMRLDRLSLHNEQGDITAQGVIDWQDDLVASLKITSDNYQARTLMPKDYQAYQNYLPKTLNGTIAIDIDANDGGMQVYDIALEQKNGERVSVHIHQKTSDQPTNPNPYHMRVQWQNYRRDDLSIGQLVTPAGVANIDLHHSKINITAQASIVQLFDLPMGEYTTNAVLVGDDLVIKHASYQGDMGDLTANGVVYLANDTRQLSYKINGNMGNLIPSVYLQKDMPLKSLNGQFVLHGRLRRKDDSDVHDVQLDVNDLTASLTDNRQITLTGTAQMIANVQDGDLGHIKASYQGELITAGIHHALAKNSVVVDVSGTMDNLLVHTLKTHGQMGQIIATGRLQLQETISWDIHANAHRLNVSMLSANLQDEIYLTGVLSSRGSYQNDNIHATATMDSTLTSPLGQNDKLAVNALIKDKQYIIDKLHYHGTAGQADLTGQVDLSSGVVADVSAVFSDLNIGVFIKDRPSNLTGNLKGSLNWQTNEQRLQIDTLHITGTVNDEKVLAKGQMAVVLDMPKDFKGYLERLHGQGRHRFNLDNAANLAYLGDMTGTLSQLQADFGALQHSVATQDEALRSVVKQLQVDNLSVAFGDNYLTAHGNQHNLSLNINAQRLSQIFPTTQGQIKGGVIVVSNNYSLPTAYVDLNFENISMPKFASAKMSVVGKLVNLGNAHSSLVVSAVNTTAANQTLKQLRLDMQGTQSNHDVRVFGNNGKMQVGMRIQGGFDGSRYQGVLSEGRLQTAFGVLNQAQPSEIVYQSDNQSLQVASHCWHSIVWSADEHGSICLQDKLVVGGDAGHVLLAIDQLDTAVFVPFMPNDLAWHSQVTGNAQVVWGKDKKPDINIALYSTNGTVGLNADSAANYTNTPNTTHMSYQRIALLATSEAQGLRLKTAIDMGQAYGKGYADVVIDPFDDDKAIKGTLLINKINLAPLRPFFPAIQDIQGNINAMGEISGTLSKPLFFGQASLNQGKLIVSAMPMNLENINATADIRGTQASMTGEFVSGTGLGKLSASMDWQNTLTAKLSLQGDDLSVANPPLLSAKINPHLEVIVRPSQKLIDIKGVIAIPEAVIRPPESTSNVIGESPDVAVIDRRMTGNVAQILGQASVWHINADIGVDLGDKVLFRGFGARLPLSGAIKISQSGQDAPSARGMVFVSERAKVDFFGQSLDLNYAQIRFVGDDIKNPTLSIEGVREIEGQTVGVRITGTPAMPIITTFNDAGLSSQQAMNALVTGTLSQSNTQVLEADFRTQVNNTLAAAGLSFGLKSTHGLTNQLGQALGFQSLTLDSSGSGANTNVNVTGYINPDLYIRYGVGVFHAQSSLSMRYQLTRRVYVEATSAVNKFVDVVYRWRF